MQAEKITNMYEQSVPIWDEAEKTQTLKKVSTKKGGVVNALMRSGSANNKKSVTLGARGPNVQSPGNAGADGSANISSMKDFKKMVSLIKNQKNRSNTPGGKKSQKKWDVFWSQNTILMSLLNKDKSSLKF